MANSKAHECPQTKNKVFLTDFLPQLTSLLLLAPGIPLRWESIKVPQSTENDVAQGIFWSEPYLSIWNETRKKQLLIV